MKTLSVALTICVAAAFAGFASCGGDDPSPGTGGTGGKGGATAAAGGSAAGGSGGTAAGGSGGTAAGGSGGSAAGGSGGSAAVDWTMCVAPEKPGVLAQDFCTYYMTKCMFKTGATSFASMDACVARYTGYSTTVKSCTAYHLCVAGKSADMATIHCPHPAQVGGPCMNP